MILVHFKINSSENSLSMGAKLTWKFETSWLIWHAFSWKGQLERSRSWKDSSWKNFPTSPCSVKNAVVCVDGKLSFEKFFPTSLSNYTYALLPCQI